MSPPQLVPHLQFISDVWVSIQLQHLLCSEGRVFVIIAINRVWPKNVHMYSKTQIVIIQYICISLVLFHTLEATTYVSCKNWAIIPSLELSLSLLWLDEVISVLFCPRGTCACLLPKNIFIFRLLNTIQRLLSSQIKVNGWTVMSNPPQVYYSTTQSFFLIFILFQSHNPDRILNFILIVRALLCDSWQYQ